MCYHTTSMHDHQCILCVHGACKSCCHSVTPLEAAVPKALKGSACKGVAQKCLVSVGSGRRARQAVKCRATDIQVATSRAA